MVDIGVDRVPANAQRAWIALAIALFLGLHSFGAVQSKRIECGGVYLSTDDGRPLSADNGKILVTIHLAF